MAITRLNSLAIPAGTVETADLSYPLTNFSSTGIDDNATSTAITINASENVGIGTTSPSNQFVVEGATGKGALEVATGLTGELQTLAYHRSDAAWLNHTTRAQNIIFKADSAGATERMRINSSGNVGIGTTSPSSTAGWDTLLEVSGTLNAGIKLTETDTANGDYSLGTTVGTLRIWDETASAWRMTLDSSGNVGIGTTSPQYKLDVVGAIRATNNSGSTIIANRTSAPGSFELQYNGTQTGQFSALSGGGIATYIGSTPSEAMRIDSSGNLLVGQTSGSSTDAGHIFNPVGVAFHVRDGGIALVVDRLTSDGDITTFRKDGTIVGSIGAKSDDAYIVTGDTGLRFNDGNDGIWPVSSSGSSRDAAIDLGNSGVRFKDIYLSGGAYLGGTGSANHLDDYEEGTWTPSFWDDGTPGTGLTYSVQTGTYTKIGRLIYIKFKIQVSGKSGSGSGQGFFIQGLPFYIKYFSTSVSTATFQAERADNITNVSAPSDLTTYSFSANQTLIYLNSSSGSVNSNSVLSNTYLEGSAVYYDYSS